MRFLQKGVCHSRQGLASQTRSGTRIQDWILDTVSRIPNLNIGRELCLVVLSDDQHRIAYRRAGQSALVVAALLIDRLHRMHPKQLDILAGSKRKPVIIERLHIVTVGDQRFVAGIDDFKIQCDRLSALPGRTILTAEQQKARSQNKPSQKRFHVKPPNSAPFNAICVSLSAICAPFSVDAPIRSARRRHYSYIKKIINTTSKSNPKTAHSTRPPRSATPAKPHNPHIQNRKPAPGSHNSPSVSCQAGNGQNFAKFCDFVRFLLGFFGPSGRYRLSQPETYSRQGVSREKRGEKMLKNPSKARRLAQKWQEKQKSGKKMNKNRFSGNKNDQPLCKFGPGGDFISSWPPGRASAIRQGPNPLRKILETIADIIGATVNPELISQLQAQANIQARQLVKNEAIEERISSAQTRADQTDHAATVRRPAANRQLRGETMLFGDNWRTGRRAKRKPTNRIRAHRRTAKKRTRQKIAGQGTLFEVNAQSQSAA